MRADSEGNFVLEQTTQLLEYLSAVAREQGRSAKQNIFDLEFHRESHGIPKTNSVTVGPSGQNNAFLTVTKVSEAPSLALPEEFNGLNIIYKNDPLVRPKLVGPQQENGLELDLQNEDSVHPTEESVIALQERFHEWVATVWEQWSIESKPRSESRKLYENLYTLRNRLESESDTVELVWGHSVISYVTKSKHALNMPLLVAPVSIELDPQNGDIRLLPDMELQLDVGPLEGSGIEGLASLQILRKELQETPIDIWDDEQRQDLRRRIVACMGLDAQLSESSAIPSPLPSVPTINDGWVIFLRQRPRLEEAFYKALSDKISSDEDFPEALASIVSDVDSVNEVVKQRGQEALTDDGSANRVLMPLPLNQEQERIARVLANSRGVTVQGPPGTGKSHTIVNLISHLVAQGKRVLVTAEKEQALKVVQDKIPSEIRDLTIAILGSTTDAIEDLRMSAQSMRDSVSSLDKESVKHRLNEIGERIDHGREESRRIDKYLERSLVQETASIEIEGRTLTAGEVAIWLDENRAQYDVIPDEISLETRCTVSIEEFNELIRLVRKVSPDLMGIEQQVIPESDEIARYRKFSEQIQEIRDLATKRTQLSNEGLRNDIGSISEQHNIEELKVQAEQSLTILRKLDTTWESSLSSALKGCDNIALWVGAENSKLAVEIDELIRIGNILLGKRIEFPELNPSTALELLDDWIAILKSKGKLPRFGGKEIKQVESQVRIDGYPVASVGDLELCKMHIHLESLQRNLSAKLAQIYAYYQIPVPAIGPAFGIQCKGVFDKIQALYVYWQYTYPQLSQRISSLISIQDPVGSVENLEASITLLGQVNLIVKLQVLQQEKSGLYGQLIQKATQTTASQMWGKLARSLENEDITVWLELLEQCDLLLEQRTIIKRLNVIAKNLSDAGAPIWCQKIFLSQGAKEVTGDFENLEKLWAYAQARTWLKRIHQGDTPEDLMKRSHEIAEELKRSVLEYTSSSARLRLAEQIQDKQRRALETWLSAVKKVGKGTGKNAPRFRAQARQALPAAMGAVPVWIMPLYRVFENFDPNISEKFDVVIVDESSQCDLLSIGVLGLAKKAVIVGDDKQTTPAAVGVDTARVAELQKMYIDNFPDKALFTADESLYGLAKKAFPSTILLREHFRCVPEIIKFSSRFYGNQLLPLREITRPELGEPLKVVYVEDGVAIQKGSNKVNEREADVLVEALVKCSQDQKYSGLTFGVVTMMSGPQKNIIESKLMEKLGLEEFESRQLRVGTPPDFQGDERNVIFMSYIADDNSYAATRQMHAQWANVGASRAQDQMWIFHSMDPSKLNHNDYRRALIEYASGLEPQSNNENLRALTESKFEEDIFDAIVNRGYDVTPQYRAGAYRIDFVVTLRSGRKLAIECDGDRFHGPEQFKDDVRRQRTLERIGWEFWRIRASVYYLDPINSLEPLWARLEELSH